MSSHKRLLPHQAALSLIAGAVAVLAPTHLPGQEPRALTTLKGHVRSIASVAFSPDGKTVASASYDTYITLLDVSGGTRTGTIVRARGHYPKAASPHPKRS
jgi:WD40 repeat protein